MAEGSQPRVIIIGGGFGGLHAAKALRRAPVRITLIDRRNHHLFQPLLYQVATAALSPAEIAYPIRAILRRQRNATVFLVEVTAIDLTERRVILADGQIDYDYLIIATGAAHSYFGHEEWAHYAPGLKSLEDALEIRRRILLAFERAERMSVGGEREAALTFTIIGGGPTGVELAGAIAEISRHVLVSDFRAIDPRDARIVLIEAGPRILPSFAEDLSRKAAEALRERGVEVLTDQPVTAVGKGWLATGRHRIATETILWAAGVAASPLARSLNLPLDRAGRVTVEADLSIAGHPEVFVVGDLANFCHQTGKPLPGVAQVAMQQGRRAAANIRASLKGAPRRPFHYRDKGNMATIGRAAAVAELGRVRMSGLVAWICWLVVHIFFLIGFRNRVLVLVQWAWAYFADERSARLITGQLDHIPADQ